MDRLRAYLEDHDVRRRALACFQCGTCAGGCPVARWRSRFNPRHFMEQLLGEDLEALVRNPDLWLCATCITCLERCPQKIQVSEILVELKNAASRLGHAPEKELVKCREIVLRGCTQAPASRILRVREELGLPALSRGAEPDDLVELAARLGWTEKPAKVPPEEAV